MKIFPFYIRKNLFGHNTIFDTQKTLFCTSPGSNLYFNCAVTSLPHTEKRSKGGEDSHSLNSEILSVADGVGGWNEVGVDPSLYSRALCENIMSEFVKNPSLPVKKIFVSACKKVKHKGSSTCTIVKIDSKNPQTKIEALNLGDSGYLILRPKIANNSLDFEIIFKSEEQTHGFNFPYQVGTGGDDPEKADVIVHEVKPYDILILASDGLWDNLSDTQVASFCKKFYEKLQKNDDNKPPTLAISDPGQLSQAITQTAEHVSLDTRYYSPFAQRSRGLFMGGKHDDITVIVAQILVSTPKF